MTLLGYHASHELFAPGELLAQLRLAQAAGFQAAMCSDHFHPWTPEQGQSAFSFAWLGAALETSSLSCGTICCPTGRYHPAIVAQAAATLAAMYPERFWLALGTGQALNEHITGDDWPDKPARQTRLREAAEVIRALWRGETVTRQGTVVVDRATLYTRPERPPLLLGAATTAATAAWVASWADGLLTVNSDPETMAEVVDAFRQHGGEGKPMFLQAMVGYDPQEDAAWEAARRNWPVAGLEQTDLQNIATPEQFAQRCKSVSVSELKGKLRVSSDLAQHRAWIAGDLELGFDRIFFYTISGNPARFLRTFGAEVLPDFARS